MEGENSSWGFWGERFCGLAACVCAAGGVLGAFRLPPPCMKEGEGGRENGGRIEMGAKSERRRRRIFCSLNGRSQSSKKILEASTFGTGLR